MNKIAIFLSVPLRKIDRQRKTGYHEQGFEVRSGSFIANYIILSYLIQFPLFSYKYKTVPIQIKITSIICK